MSTKDTISKQFSSAKNALRNASSEWDDREKIAYGKLTGNTDQVKTRISTGDLSSMLWERAARVAAQSPTGLIQPVTEADARDSDILNLTVQNYIIPNQKQPFTITQRLWVFNSYIYGQMPVLAYWRVEDDYVGPDAMLINPRNVFIQAGKSSTYDAEYVFVSTFVSEAWMKAQAKLPGWNGAAIKRVLKQAEDGAVRPAGKDDAERQTSLDSRNSNEQGDTKEYEVVTKYERGTDGRWITFLPDYDNEIIRDIPNKLKSGKLPVIWKHTMPLLTSPYDVSDVERGESLQKATDSFVNLAHEGAKYNVYPIHKYKRGAVQRASMKWQPGAFWAVDNMNDVDIHQIGQNNLESFTKIYQFLKSAQLNLFGTDDTMISSQDGNPSFSKTPAGTKRREEIQVTRDKWDRDMYEQAFGELMEIWIEMIVNNNEVPMEFYVADEDIKTAHKAGITEDGRDGMGNMRRQGIAKVVVSPSKLKGQYRFKVDPGSSVTKEDSEEHERITEIMSMAIQVGPDMINQILQMFGKKFNFGELFSKWIQSAGINGVSDIISDENPSDMPDVPPAGIPAEVQNIQDPQTMDLVNQIAMEAGLQ